MTKEELLAKHKYELEHRLEIITNYFNNLKPFETADDIPDIPMVDEETYNNVIVPNLIRCGAIPKDKLMPGHNYLGTCRNASTAVWNGTCFTYKRTKWGSTYDEDINHFQDDDGFDLFVPFKEVEKTC